MVVLCVEAFLKAILAKKANRQRIDLSWFCLRSQTMIVVCVEFFRLAKLQKKPSAHTTRWTYELTCSYSSKASKQKKASAHKTSMIVRLSRNPEACMFSLALQNGGLSQRRTAPRGKRRVHREGAGWGPKGGRHGRVARAAPHGLLGAGGALLAHCSTLAPHDKSYACEKDPSFVPGIC